jgi:16S rRNA (guanine966-N2)-methyltransferase
MRVLAGQFKGRELKSPKGDKTRPTSSKVKESLFNIVRDRIEEALFLDLFAGSGSMGIEALSRGAKGAYFVERDREAAACIKKNLENLETEGHVLQMDAFIAIKHLEKQGLVFNLIYVDPPYALGITDLLGRLTPLLGKEGLLMVEQSKRAQLDEVALRKVDERTFGDTVIYFFAP